MAINPNTLASTLPQNDYHLSGGLGGYVSGMQIADYLDNMGRARRSDDQEYATKQNELDNSLADNPLKAATRQLGLSKTGLEQGLMNDGTTERVLREKATNEIEEIHAKRGARGVKEVQDQADLIWEMDNAMKSGMLDQTNYSKYVKRGQNLGMEMPPTLTPEFQKQISENAKLAGITRKAAEQRWVQSQHEAWQGGQGDLNRQSALEIAKARAAAMGNKGAADNAFIRAIDDADVIDASDVSRYAVALENKQKGVLQSVVTAGMRRDALTEFNTKPKEWREKNGPASAYADKIVNDMLREQMVDSTLRSLQGKTVKMPDGTTHVIGDKSKPVIEKLVKGVETNGTQTQGQGKASPRAAAGQASSASGPASKQDSVIDQDPRLKEASRRLGTKEPQAIADAIAKSPGDEKTKQLLYKMLGVQPAGQAPSQQQAPAASQPAQPAASTPVDPRKAGLQKGLSQIQSQIQELGKKSNPTKEDIQQLQELIKTHSDLQKAIDTPDSNTPISGVYSLNPNA